MTFQKIYVFSTGKQEDSIVFDDPHLPYQFDVKHPTKGFAEFPTITTLPEGRFLELTKFASVSDLLISNTLKNALDQDWLRAFNEFGIELDNLFVSPYGDMKKSVYDADNDGIVDVAKSLDDSIFTGNLEYFGTDGSGNVGVHTLPVYGDMFKTTYDTNDDGKVNSADVADSLSGTPGTNEYYGTDGVGTKGYHALPPVGGDYSQRLPFNLVAPGFQQVIPHTAGRQVNAWFEVGGQRVVIGWFSDNANLTIIGTQALAGFANLS